MSDKMAVIFGAGRLSRAFLAPLLAKSEYQLTFIERAPILVDMLRERRRYKVKVIGAPQNDLVINGFHVLTHYEELAIADAVAAADVVFVSIGGPNLPEISPLIADGIRFAKEIERAEPLNILVCENHFQPALVLKNLVLEKLNDEEKEWAASRVGFVETIVLTSCIDPTAEMESEDPLSLRAQDMWELPADAAAFAGEPPPIAGLTPKTDFQGALVRKLFTYNSLNAVMAYSGYQHGYQLLAEAAEDPEIKALVEKAAVEVNQALCAEYGYDPEDQHKFSDAAVYKYSSREFVDPILRNTRDPIRKLSRNDRLIGPAQLALEHGIKPLALAKAIVAALRYDHPEDPGAYNVHAMISSKGLPAALEEICQIPKDSELAQLIIETFEGAEISWLG